MAMEDSPRHRLRQALLVARRTGDREVAGALRGALAAFDNAEAVPAGPVTDGALDGIPTGVGTTEAERRVLTVADEQHLLAAEVGELRAAAAAYDEHGHPERALAAIRAADVVEGCA